MLLLGCKLALQVLINTKSPGAYLAGAFLGNYPGNKCHNT